MTSILPAVLALAALDAVNPTSIAGAIYLAGAGQTARLRMFILAVYCTYLTFGLALTLGPGAALRSALADTSNRFGATVEVAAGALLVGVGVRVWRQRRTTHGPPVQAAPPATRSGAALGVVATLADLPTAAPLLVATALLAGATSKLSAQAATLGLYNLVYVSPLVAVALAGRSGAARGTVNGLGRRSSPSYPPALAALCVATGAIIGCEGVAALL
jgi:cytochrome c biogenesis protein CcdA